MKNKILIVRVLFSFCLLQMGCVSSDDAIRDATFARADFQIRPGVTTEVFNLDLRVVENGAVTYERYGFHQTGSDWSLINIATKAG